MMSELCGMGWSLPALLRHGIIADDTALLAHLAVASPATIDRLPARFD